MKELRDYYNEFPERDRWPQDIIDEENDRLMKANPFWPGLIVRHFKTPDVNGFYVIESFGNCSETGRTKIYYHKLVDPMQKYDRFMAEFFTDVSEHPENLTGQTTRFERIEGERIAISVTD